MRIVNRQFHRDYEELEKLEAGIVLTGAEVKAIRAGQLQLEDAFVKLMGDECSLINANIGAYAFSKNEEYDPKRSRKLLIHKREILRLHTKLKAGGRLTMAPVSCYNRGRHIKLEIALVRPRKDLEKRKLEKQRDVIRNEKREVKEYMKV